jgi:hypothetical protein
MKGTGAGEEQSYAPVSDLGEVEISGKPGSTCSYHPKLWHVGICWLKICEQYQKRRRFGVGQSAFVSSFVDNRIRLWISIMAWKKFTGISE